MATGPQDALSLRGAASEVAVCLCVQHQPVYCLPDLFDGGQVDVAVQQGAGVHVVEQRGDQALRRGPAGLRREGGAVGGGGQYGGGGGGEPGGAPAPCAVRGG